MLGSIPMRRYLATMYLKELAGNGTLFLSTVSRCRAHEESAKADPFEGVRKFSNGGEEMTQHDPTSVLQGSNIVFKNQDGSVPSFYAAPGSDVMLATHLEDAYVLCFARGDHEQMVKKFGVATYFSVEDVEKLGQEILMQLSNQDIKIFAYCFDYVRYVESKNEKHHTISEKSGVNFDKSALSPGEIVNLSRIRRAFDNYFTKQSANFSDEKEYRLVFYCHNPEDVVSAGLELTLDPAIVKTLIKIH